MVGEGHAPILPAPGHGQINDHEYVRHGVATLFVEVEPLAGRRHIEVTQRRTRQDWARFIKTMLDELEIDIGSYTGTEDGILLSGANAARNYGASNSLYLGKTIASGSPVESRALLRFDLSSLHEVADLIESATLTLTFVSGTNAANVGV